MFIPLGDDVDTRKFPAVGSILIALCCVVYAFEHRLWVESRSRLPRFQLEDLHSQVDEKAHAERVAAAVKMTPYYDFIDTWAVSPRNLRQGHFLSLVSYMFLHGDFFHLLGNMVVLWAFVGTLENALGPAGFLCMYLLWGVLAALAHLAFNWQADLPMIGASGAISGMIGGYFIVFGALTHIRVLVWFIVPLGRYHIPAGAFVLIWICTQLHGLDQAQQYGIDDVAWYAHLGGFAAGTLTMLFMRREIRSRMYRDAYGVWQIRDVSPTPDTEAVKELPAEELPSRTEVPPGMPVCPDCGTELSDKNKIHDFLLRCPNPKCQKLIYTQ
ncbi:MAG: rhomboid family intramembrane serine protease [Gemmatales bacterium]|nr:MAG: rhomboid family intramembrane serine protease [Gemmatales bacterium]